MTQFKTSKLQFKRAFGKNFRSIDNMGLEFIFNREGSAVVVGSLDNGAGKSTMLIHLLYYVVFDKPYGKGSTKSGLINSRSNKDCVGEIEFAVNGHDWKVIRGQKPTLFEIYKDGVKVDDEASLADYQKNLTKVIGMDEKVFCNTIALGKDKFVPFVDMSTPDRRNYGEQMLDATVFSAMNEINKARIKATTSEQLTINSSLNQLALKIQGVENVIAVKMQATARQVGDLEERFEEKVKAGKEYGSRVLAARNEVARLTTEIEQLRPLQEARNTFAQAVDKVKANLRDKQAELERARFQKTHCHACSQPLPQENREALIESINQAIQTVSDRLEVAEVKLRGMKDYSEDLRALETSLRTHQSNQAVAESQLEGATLEAKKIRAQINDIVNSQKPDWSADEAELEKLKKDRSDAEAKLKQLDVDMIHHKIQEAGLKDDGAKSQIILQYLPFINERINWYIEQMNMFVHVELDAEFELNMVAPDRRGQTIANLSTGQKTRIDLATLLAWRDVARLSASCDSNILILDEILENMSENGVSDFLEMWGRTDAKETTGLYVITQRVTEFRQQFDHSVIYGLKDGATYLVEED